MRVIQRRGGGSPLQTHHRPGFLRRSTTPDATGRVGPDLVCEGSHLGCTPIHDRRVRQYMFAGQLTPLLRYSVKELHDLVQKGLIALVLIAYGGSGANRLSRSGQFRLNACFLIFWIKGLDLVEEGAGIEVRSLHQAKRSLTNGSTRDRTLNGTLISTGRLGRSLGERCNRQVVSCIPTCLRASIPSLGFGVQSLVDLFASKERLRIGGRRKGCTLQVFIKHRQFGAEVIIFRNSARQSFHAELLCHFKPMPPRDDLKAIRLLAALIYNLWANQDRASKSDFADALDECGEGFLVNRPRILANTKLAKRDIAGFHSLAPDRSAGDNESVGLDNLDDCQRLASDPRVPSNRSLPSGVAIRARPSPRRGEKSREVRVAGIALRQSVVLGQSPIELVSLVRAVPEYRQTNRKGALVKQPLTNLGWRLLGSRLPQLCFPSVNPHHLHAPINDPAVDRITPAMGKIKVHAQEGGRAIKPFDGRLGQTEPVCGIHRRQDGFVAAAAEISVKGVVKAFDVLRGIATMNGNRPDDVLVRFLLSSKPMVAVNEDQIAVQQREVELIPIAPLFASHDVRKDVDVNAARRLQITRLSRIPTATQDSTRLRGRERNDTITDQVQRVKIRARTNLRGIAATATKLYSFHCLFLMAACFGGAAIFYDRRLGVRAEERSEIRETVKPRTHGSITRMAPHRMRIAVPGMTAPSMCFQRQAHQTSAMLADASHIFRMNAMNTVMLRLLQWRRGRRLGCAQPYRGLRARHSLGAAPAGHCGPLSGRASPETDQAARLRL